jgi:hypothetical protein
MMGLSHHHRWLMVGKLEDELLQDSSSTIKMWNCKGLELYVLLSDREKMSRRPKRLCNVQASKKNRQSCGKRYFATYVNISSNCPRFACLDVLDISREIASGRTKQTHLIKTGSFELMAPKRVTAAPKAAAKTATRSPRGRGRAEPVVVEDEEEIQEEEQEESQDEEQEESQEEESEEDSEPGSNRRVPPRKRHRPEIVPAWAQQFAHQLTFLTDRINSVEDKMGSPPGQTGQLPPMDRNSGTHSFKEFLETASGSFGEILKPKIRLAKNLAMVEELSDIMKAFSVLRTGMDVSMALPLLGINTAAADPNNLRRFLAARQMAMLWQPPTASTTTEKEAWKLGVYITGELIAATVALRYSPQRAEQARSEYLAGFTAGTIDHSSVLEKIFSSRNGTGGFTAGMRHPQDNSRAQAQVRKCKFCDQDHKGSWAAHKCPKK